MTISRFGVLLLIALTGGGTCIGAPARGAENSQTGADAANTFLVFDGLHNKNHPDLSRYGIRPINIIYHNAFWSKGQPQDQPQEKEVRAAARKAAATGQLACIDIEHWIREYKRGDATAAQMIRKYARVADWMHQARPGLRLGYYRVLPINEHRPVMQGGDELQGWHQKNARLDALADHVDVVFPSLYTRYNDPQKWVKYARANLRQARRYHKRVYAFLMPYYHPNNKKLGGQLIPAKDWKLELETCRRYADGLVIWESGRKKWDESAPWWRETKAFMQKINSSTSDKPEHASPK